MRRSWKNMMMHLLMLQNLQEDCEVYLFLLSTNLVSSASSENEYGDAISMLCSDVEEQREIAAMLRSERENEGEREESLSSICVYSLL
mmetsp:Transcript_8763/g.12765  ORF Transcript_8763/g.12765 Transcript_8763/m.12765 type:complete len:88 (-) Transcript_8763:343-606(-)